MTDLRIGVVLGSARPERLGDRVCRFVMKAAVEVAGAEFTVLDLADYAMPFFDEAIAPLNNRARNPIPGVGRCRSLRRLPLPHARIQLFPARRPQERLGLLAREAEAKPAAILSYSDTSHGGNIAGNELRPTLCKLGMLPLPKSLPLAHAERVLDVGGVIAESSDWASKVAAFVPWSLTELVRYTAALKPLRAA